MTLEKMNTENMGLFLKQVSEAHKLDFITMVLDGAPSHKGKELEVPENIALLFLPSYSPDRSYAVLACEARQVGSELPVREKRWKRSLTWPAVSDGSFLLICRAIKARSTRAI